MSEAPAHGYPYGVLFNRLASEFVAMFRHEVKDLGITSASFMTLKQLQVMKNATQVSLAKALAVDFSNMGHVAHDLEEKGLIKKTRSTEDKRAVIVCLTAKGKRVIQEAEERIWNGEGKLLASLNPEEREELWGMLRKLADHHGLCPESPYGRDWKLCVFQSGEEGPINIALSDNPTRRKVLLQNENKERLRLLAITPSSEQEEREILEQLEPHQLVVKWFANHPDVRRVVAQLVTKSEDL